MCSTRARAAGQQPHQRKQQHQLHTNNLPGDKGGLSMLNHVWQTRTCCWPATASTRATAPAEQEQHNLDSPMWMHQCGFNMDWGTPQTPTCCSVNMRVRGSAARDCIRPWDCIRTATHGADYCRQHHQHAHVGQRVRCTPPRTWGSTCTATRRRATNVPPMIAGSIVIAAKLSIAASGSWDENARNDRHAAQWHLRPGAGLQ